MGGGDFEEAPPLGAAELVTAVSLLLVAVAISRALSLNLEAKICVAAARCAVQLLVLGYCLLVPLFESKSVWAILGYLCFMLVVAAAEAANRSARRYPGVYKHALCAIGGAVSFTLIFCLALIVKARPFWNPHVVIPIAGMLLGNCITAFSLSLDRLLAELTEEGAPKVELYLSFGAGRYEAAAPAVAAAAVAGMTPSLNSMSVVGLVSIPGMMTGQILGGQPPESAAKYQMMIIFLLCSTGAMGMMCGQVLALSAIFDDRARLRAERVVKRQGSKKDLLMGLALGALELLKSLRKQISAGLSTNPADGGYAPVQQHEVELKERPDDGDGDAKGILADAEPDVAVASFLTEGLVRGADPRVGIDVARSGKSASGEAGALRVSGLHVGVHGSKRRSGGATRLLVRDVAFGLLSGECLCVTGKSGVGKSRLLRQLTLLDPPHNDDGSSQSDLGFGVKVGHGLKLRLAENGIVGLVPRLRPRSLSEAEEADLEAQMDAASGEGDDIGGNMACFGHFVGDMPPQDWRSRVVYVPQDVPALAGTPRELLATFRGFRAQRKRRRQPGGPEPLGEQQEDAIALRLGLDAVVDLSSAWARLSGGQRQRALLWIALCTRPDVLILDEPTSACDAKTTLNIEKLLVELRLTMVIVTHNEDQVKRMATYHLHVARNRQVPISDEGVFELTTSL
uniref:ABC transporter domain-containing protein n=1 Tax=Phaeomonas parva TaxID=124430 RepID=A0A7S1TZ88_9STRA|mmetsp:Transcript_24712/g.77480  ORF Transcript_24712/g.77480 Transcript_24712/m.77480 type:complete len:682 (+) Transcript_24712:75-2120(+)